MKFDGPAPVIVEFGGKQHQHEIGTVGFLCRAHVVLTRHTMVADADRRESQARHFVEMGTWRAGCCAAAGMRVFTWRVFEVKGGGWQQVADEQMTEPGSIFPAPADRGAGARFTRLTTGQIGYELVLDTPRRGVLAPQ